jgi:predicted ATPase
MSRDRERPFVIIGGPEAGKTILIDANKCEHLRMMEIARCWFKSS